MLDITEEIWVKTKHKLRKAYALTEERFNQVKLLDVICMVMPTQFTDPGFPEPQSVTGLQLGYQILAEVDGQLVTTSGFWDEAVHMDQTELDADAMFRVSQWVLALRVLGGRKWQKELEQVP